MNIRFLSDHASEVLQDGPEAGLRWNRLRKNKLLWGGGGGGGVLQLPEPTTFVAIQKLLGPFASDVQPDMCSHMQEPEAAAGNGRRKKKAPPPECTLCKQPADRVWLMCGCGCRTHTECMARHFLGRQQGVAAAADDVNGLPIGGNCPRCGKGVQLAGGPRPAAVCGLDAEPAEEEEVSKQHATVLASSLLAILIRLCCRRPAFELDFKAGDWTSTPDMICILQDAGADKSQPCGGLQGQEWLGRG